MERGTNPSIQIIKCYIVLKNLSLEFILSCREMDRVSYQNNNQVVAYTVITPENRLEMQLEKFIPLKPDMHFRNSWQYDSLYKPRGELLLVVLFACTFSRTRISQEKLASSRYKVLSVVGSDIF